jgi:8-oxo-dGTP diphosphatase
MNPELPKCFYRISVKALILDATRTKFLVVQEHNKKWELPGGGLDWGESVETGLAREIREEMGLAILQMAKKPSYFFTGVTATSKTQFANVVYEVVLPHLDFTPSDECVAIAFVTKEEARELDAFSSVYLLAEHFDVRNHMSALS